MTRWKLTVEYDGSDFSGWQRQANALSVQKVLEEALRKFSGEKVTLHVAGRTDAGVHALGNVAHVDLLKETTAETVRDAVNAHVRPHKVAVVQAEAVADSFHARFAARQRAYQYVIINRRTPSPLQEGRAWHVRKPLDPAAMQAAAAAFPSGDPCR